MGARAYHPGMDDDMKILEVPDQDFIAFLKALGMTDEEIAGILKEQGKLQ